MMPLTFEWASRRQQIHLSVCPKRLEKRNVIVCVVVFVVFVIIAVVVVVARDFVVVHIIYVSIISSFAPWSPSLILLED